MILSDQICSDVQLAAIGIEDNRQPGWHLLTARLMENAALAIRAEVATEEARQQVAFEMSPAPVSQPKTQS